MIIDLYHFSLTANAAQLCAAKTVLSDDEVLRFHRMIPIWCNRNIAARAMLRHLLSERIECNPRDVRFSYGKYGKPSLDSKLDTSISFNLAHSADLAVIAIGKGVDIGVDLEEMRGDIEYDLLSKNVFSQSELSVFRKMSDAQRCFSFYTAWTRKEAFVKATGEGISRPLSSFEVDFENQGVVFVSDSLVQSSLPIWSLIDIATAPGFTGALAVGCCQVMVLHHEVQIPEL